MIILNVTYNIKPGMRASFVNALQENQVFLLERYEDEEAFAFHKEQEHFKKLQEIKAEYVLSTDIQILNS